MDRYPINLRIGHQMHQITVTQATEKYFRDAADLINDRYNKYKQSYQNQSTDLYNAIVMLDIAVRYLQSQENHDADPYVAAIKALTAEVEEVLGTK